MVRARLAGWFEGAAATEFARQIAVYYGPQSAHALLERTTWHAAQHLRQLYALLEGAGVTSEAPLDDADYRGLPLPKEIW